jgi:hypothetical protein
MLFRHIQIGLSALTSRLNEEAVVLTNTMASSFFSIDEERKLNYVGLSLIVRISSPRYIHAAAARNASEVARGHAEGKNS